VPFFRGAIRAWCCLQPLYSTGADLKRRRTLALTSSFLPCLWHRDSVRQWSCNWQTILSGKICRRW